MNCDIIEMIMHEVITVQIYMKSFPKIQCSKNVIIVANRSHAYITNDYLRHTCGITKEKSQLIRKYRLCLSIG